MLLHNNKIKTKLAVFAILSVVVLLPVLIMIAAGINTTFSKIGRTQRSSDTYQAAIEARVYVMDYWKSNRALPENLHAFFAGPGRRFPSEIRSSIHYSKKEDAWSITIPFNKNEVLVFSGVGYDIYAETVHPLVESAAEVRRALSEISEEGMMLEEFRDLVEGGEAVVVDARPEAFHRLGHVPGALSLPVKDFNASYAKYRSRLEADKGALVMVYCSNKACKDSALVGGALKKLGYTRVVIFKGGWKEWTDAGLPEERT